jgi:hypothetical protein
MEQFGPMMTARMADFLEGSFQCRHNATNLLLREAIIIIIIKSRFRGNTPKRSHDIGAE